MANINLIKKIDYAIRHDPSLIPILFKDCSIPKGLLYSRLRRAVPHRVGIEFEGCGTLIGNLRLSNPKINKKSIKNLYNIYEYSEDHPELKHNDMNEIRVSIKDFHQLHGLKKIIDDMKKYCTIPEGGGIHIHIDLSKYKSTAEKSVCKGFLKKNLNKVEAIFPQYTGKYNKRIVGILKKGSYVNLSYHNTVEFRIAPLTYDYDTVIDWIIKCNKLVSEMISRCHLNTNGYSLDSDQKKEVHTFNSSHWDRRLENLSAIDRSSSQVPSPTAYTNGGLDYSDLPYTNSQYLEVVMRSDRMYSLHFG